MPSTRLRWLKYSISAIESQPATAVIDVRKLSSIRLASSLCWRVSSKTSSAASPKASTMSSLNFLSWTPCSVMNCWSNPGFLAFTSE